MDKQLPVSVWPEWKITEKIGEGSFGKVYKAQRVVNEKVFYSAIKIISIPSSQSELNSIRSENGNDQSARAYFKNLVDECIQEVSTMEYFRGNSHVVSVEDYKVVEYLDDIGWDIYIRMEYLTSFLDYCAGKQLKEEDVIKLGIDLCKALEYCQKLNIIHRDIKPENIFVSRFGEFKLGDFGIARELERSMSGLSKKGTYSYMAPEMYRGEQYDYKVDIYSLGLVLYKLRNNNRMPFMSLEKQLITYRDKEMALSKRMADEKMKPPVQASEELGKVILKACAFSREDRYDTPEEFRRDLEWVAAGEKVFADVENLNDLDVAIATALAGKNLVDSSANGQKSSNVLEVPLFSKLRRSLEKSGKEENINKEKNIEKINKAEESSNATDSNLKSSDYNNVDYEETEFEKTIVRKKTKGGNSISERNESAESKTSLSKVRKQALKTESKAESKSGKKSPDRASRRRNDVSQKPLWAAVIVMSVAVVLLTAMFVKLMLDESRYDKGNVVIVDDSANPQLAEDLTVIRQYANTIEADLPIYNWIGSEEYGQITYLNQDAQVMKILIYPSSSEDGVYEEYYYWDEELFFAYIWTEEESNHYYYMDGELIRWIDQKNRCHDGETDNSEYVERGAKYYASGSRYLQEMKE